MVILKSLLEISSQLLKDGDSTREICPFCGGGTTHEVSFHMTRCGMHANYVCYRASCYIKGYINYGGMPDTNQKLHVTSYTNHWYSGKCSKLSIAYSNYIKSKYNIQPALLREYKVKQTEDGRILFPILKFNGTSRGDNVRYYSDLDGIIQDRYKAKSIIYMPPKEIALSWHKIRNGLAIPQFFDKMLIIVEDQVSAIKASRMVDSVALLGTNFNQAKILEIAHQVVINNNYKDVIMLLDADAYSQAIKLVNRTRSLLEGIQVRRLEKDIKDMSYIQLYALLSSIPQLKP